MPRWFNFALIGILLFTMVGCKKQTLVGKWKSDILPLEIEFLSDQTMNMTMSQGVTVNAVGKWKQEGPRLTMSDFQLQGLPGMFGNMGDMAKEQTVELSWKSDKQIILTGGGFISGAFTRVTE
ncbi:MAG: hypothetical protein R2688_00285 [Fimbriimonadaceae bacterium]